MLMSIFPYGTFIVIFIFVVSSAYSEITVFPVHGHAGSIHLGTDIVGRNRFELTDQFRVKLHSKFIRLSNSIREFSDYRSAAGHFFLNFPFEYPKKFCHIPAERHPLQNTQLSPQFDML
mgnify:FL=1